MGSSWTNRGTYGRILKKLIQRQLRRFEIEGDSDKTIQLAHNIGYLIGIQRDLLRDESKLEERVQKLEELAGIVKKGTIAK